ncbi:DUF4239 domain-containing protein [Aquabacter spiritensis]|uniref:Uncharacterized protein DUF4239 n=1 Tax=Aquabacter spiritensis TaxID=933073 RepID=A0A4R3M0L1_9HYPH|nr:DUF4239 domain-containing protein [Aquabacter spiritensis]TCT06560.1 uncharacterized protein DUF4239 [Aquabacter spiritensis]
MDTWVIAISSFGGMFGGGLAAIFIARGLAAHHVSAKTQDTVKLGVGMVAAMASLILGLMTASVKGNFDQTDKDVHTYALNIQSLAVDLHHYGPPACHAQVLLGDYTRAVVRETWPDGPDLPARASQARSGEILLLIDTIVRNFTPDTPILQEVRSAAMGDLRSILTTRWTVSEDAITVVPTAFIVVLVVWLSLIFVSFGLFAPPNRVVVISFFLCAISIAGALFLIMEMSGPFDGMIKVQPKPMVQVIQSIDDNGCK